MEANLESFIEWVNTPLVHIGQAPVTLGGILSAIFVIIAALLVSAILQKIISSRLSKHPKVSAGMSYALQRILHYTILFISLIVAAQCVGLNLGSLTVALGFLGVGVGLGLQNITANFVAGIVLLLERPISVGDFISIEGTIGKVLNISMRATTIMTIDNITIIVPNSKFIEGNVTNWSIQDPRVRLHCPVGVAYGSDIEKVKNALMGVAESHPDALEDPAPEVRFMEFGNSSLNFDLLVWVDEPKKQFLIKSQINYMIDEAFRKAGVRIPFPQRDLHLQMTPAVEKLAKGGDG